MSVKAMSWVWDHSEADGNARLVLLAIADNAHDDGRDAYPGQQEIARKCRLSVRTVRRAIEELVALGELEIARHAGVASRSGEGRRTHRYTLSKLADNLTANRVDSGEVGGQLGGSWRPNRASWRPTVAGEPSIEPSIEPPRVRKEEHVIAYRLYNGLRVRNRQVRLNECKELVANARDAGIADHIIDETVGRGLANSDVQWPSWFAKALQTDRISA
jgi:hypothetical protein